MLRIVCAIAIIFLSLLSDSHAQQPTISSIDSKSGTANSTLVISGSNFGTDPTVLKVAFGPAYAEILSITNNTLTVKVPPGSSYAPVTVTNIQSGLSARSKQSFLLSFGGDKFDNSIALGSDVFPAGNGLSEHCLCDFNNDGLVDIATANLNSVDLSIFRNIGTIDQILFSKTNIRVNSQTTSIACEDLDGDGKKDLVAAKSGGDGDQIFVLKNYGTSTAIQFADGLVYFSQGNIVKKIILMDVDQDGKPEIIASSEGENTLSVFRNISTPGNINFDPTPKLIYIEGATRSNYIELKDLNGDGLPEIIASRFLGEEIFILGNKSTVGSISFSTAQFVKVSSGVNNIISGDVNNDDTNDIIYTNSSSGEIVVLLNKTPSRNLTFEFTDPHTFTAVPNLWGIELSDIDGNGKVDIIAASTDITRRITILSNVSTGSVLTFDKFYISTNERSKSIKLGDLNNDGKPDISYAGIDNSNIIINQNLNCIAPIITPRAPLVICKDSGTKLQVPLGIAVSYEWSLDNIVMTGETRNSINVMYPGVYKVRIRDSKNLCDRTSEGAKVTVIDPNSTEPSIQILTDKDQFCTGDSVLLESYGDYVDYKWSTGETTKSIYVKEGGEYTLTVTVEGGCKTFGVKTITELDPPIVTVTSDFSSVRKGLAVQLSASGGTTYSWLPADGLNDPNISNPIAKPTETTTYTVIATNESGCSASAEITISLESTALKVSPQKIFSPNFDGIQDYWVIEDIANYPDCEVSIFSRSGEKVFTAKPYTNNFDGTRNGRPLPPGDYYYIIQSFETMAQKKGAFRITR